MTLEFKSDELTAQEEIDIIRMLNSRQPLVGVGKDRRYHNKKKENGKLQIRVENKLLKGSNKFRNVWIKPIY